MIILLWLFVSVAVGMFANGKGQSGIGFFFLSLILSPLVGFIIALTSENKIENNSPDKQFYRWFYSKCNGDYDKAAEILDFDDYQRISYGSLFTAWQEWKAIEN